MLRFKISAAINARFITLSKVLFLIGIAFSSLPCLAVTNSLYSLSTESSLNPIITTISLHGLKQFESKDIMSYVPLKVGTIFDIDASNKMLHTLYDTGFFQNIKLYLQQSHLIIAVQERPVIASLTITGDKAFDHDKLLQSLKDNGLASSLLFDRSVLENAILSLKSEYYNRGLYSAHLTSSVKNLPRNRVAVSINIKEGNPAKIIDISFTGNDNFSANELQKQLFLHTGHLLSFWYKDNQYSSEKLNGDIATIKNFYQNQGYINYRLNSVQVQLSPDKQSVYITINIHEGAQYRISHINLAGDNQNVPSDQLQELLPHKLGMVVNQSDIDKISTNLKNLAGNYGYAAATVNAVPTLDDTKHLAAYTFFLNLNKKIYIRKINIGGNIKTRDVVIRRELRQEEAALYDFAAIQRSKERLAGLGYFKNVEFNTAPVPLLNDQLDLDIHVTENNIGSISFALGYAQGQGIIVNGGFTQPNFFGSGKAGSIMASTSQLSSNISLSFTDPYFLPNGVSLGYDIYDSWFTPDSADISPYSTQTIGIRTRTSVPVSEYDRINGSIGFENNQISINDNTAPSRFIEFTDQYGDSVNAIPVALSWARNTTDNRLWPTTGATYSQTISATLPGVGSQYYKFDSVDAWYFPLTKDLTWKTNGELGFINAYGANQIVPFYQNFLEGGPSSIRGYYIGSIGPKDTDDSSLGGTRWAFISNNLLFPLSGTKEEHAARLSAFYDIGTLYGGNSFDLTAAQMIRASYGVALLWLSPLGPIQVSYAFPMFNQPSDSIQNFQFTIGTMF